MSYQSEQLSIVLITILLVILIFVGSNKLKKINAGEKPGRFLSALMSYVSFINNYTVENMGKKHGSRMAAYIGVVFIYLIVSNVSGLLGLSAPTQNLSVTLMFGAITWILIQVAKFQSNGGFGGYLKTYLEPSVLFLVPNIFSEIAPLISLSFRLFGNIIAGSVIMSLVYTFTGWLSSFIPVIGNFNFLGVIVAPPLHLFFDVFLGFIQAFIFVTLSMVLISIEFSGIEEEN